MTVLSGDPHTWKDGLYIETRPDSLALQHQTISYWCTDQMCFCETIISMAKCKSDITPVR